MAVGNEEATTTTKHETAPPVGPELIGWRDRGNAIDIASVAGRHAERHIERLGHVLRLGKYHARHDRQVPKIRFVLTPRGPPVRDRGWNVDSQLETPVERQIELEETRVLIAVLEEVVRVAVGRYAQSIEDAVEGVQPTLARRASPAGRWTDPRLVPALREDAAPGHLAPSLGFGVHVPCQ